MTERDTSRPAPDAVPVLEVRGLSKSYGAVRAVRAVSFALYPGEVLGLLGDNGAGKSTLVGCLAGSVRADSGRILIGGEDVTIDTPQSARRLGIETVFQDLALVDGLDVTTNMFLNREILRPPPLGWLRWMDRRAMRAETEAILDRLHISITSVRQRMDQLSGGQRQSVAVGRAVAWGHRIVLLDEPAAALGVEQTALVLDLIRRLRSENVGVLLISHNMHDVLEVCDRAVVLRHGLKITQLDDLSAATPRQLVDAITGVSLGDSDVARHSESD